MHRRVEIEKSGVGQRLPLVTRADEPNTAFPDLCPRRSVFSANALEAIELCLRGHSGCLLIGVMMHDPANDTHQLRQTVSLSRLGAEGIGTFESIARKRWSFGFGAGGLASFHLGDIRKAHLPYRAGTLPEKRPLACRLGLTGRFSGMAERPTRNP